MMYCFELLGCEACVGNEVGIIGLVEDGVKPARLQVSGRIPLTGGNESCSFEDDVEK